MSWQGAVFAGGVLAAIGFVGVVIDLRRQRAWKQWQQNRKARRKARRGKLCDHAVACARCVKVLERKNTELALEVNRLDYRLHRMRQAFHRIGIRYDGARRGMRHWFDRYKGVCSDYERLACRLDRMRRAFKRVAWVGVMLSWAFADRRFVTALRRVARQQVGGQP